MRTSNAKCALIVSVLIFSLSSLGCSAILDTDKLKEGKKDGAAVEMGLDAGVDLPAGDAAGADMAGTDMAKGDAMADQGQAAPDAPLADMPGHDALAGADSGLGDASTGKPDMAGMDQGMTAPDQGQPDAGMTTPDMAAPDQGMTAPDLSLFNDGMLGDGGACGSEYPAVGCCMGPATLRICVGGTPQTIDCPSVFGMPFCGWDFGQARYGCGSDPITAPGGNPPRMCPGVDMFIPPPPDQGMIADQGGPAPDLFIPPTPDQGMSADQAVVLPDTYTPPTPDSSSASPDQGAGADAI